MPRFHAKYSRQPLQRGMTLVESLIALVVLAGSTLTVGRLQAQLGLDVDIARQRSEAVRLGEGELEDLRAWAALGAASSAHSYAAIGDGERVVDGGSGYASNTSFRIARHVDAGVFAGGKVARVDVRWTDRAGATQAISLDSMMAAVAPAYASALALGGGTISGITRGAYGRAPSIPADAIAIGAGRSAHKTFPGASTAVVYDDASGDVVGRCQGIAAARATRDLTGADLARCTSGRWLVVSGTIRFSETSPPRPGSPDAAPLQTAIDLNLDGGDYAEAPQCQSAPMKTVRYHAAGSLHVDTVPIDALPASLGLTSWDDSGERYSAWQCLVSPRGDGRWSGRASLVGVGWQIGLRSDEHRVCRFSADADGSGAIDTNVEHPLDYRNVGSGLVAQNFLVVRGSEACPADRGTVQHQPS